MPIQVLLMSVVLAANGLLIAANAKGQNLYVSVYREDGGCILQITPSGSFIGGAGQLGTGTPLGIAFNSSGELFVCGYTNILKISTNGVVSIFANKLVGTNPRALAFNSAGTLFVSTYDAYASVGYIIRVNADGITRTTFASGLDYPVGLAFDSAGNLFEADAYSGNIYKFTPTGVKSTFASGLWEPFGLAFNSAGHLFVAEYASGNIYEYTQSGTKSTFASGLDCPVGLAFNTTGDLFVAQRGAGGGQYATYIMKISPSGGTNVFGKSMILPWGVAFPPLPPNIQAANSGSNLLISVSMPSPYYSTLLQASTNLVNWVNVNTNTPSFIFTDSIASFPHRFYRASVIR